MALRDGRQPPRGFTLVELMIVSTIIGVLASVAIPTFTQMRYRSMAAERPLMLKRLKQGIQDYVLRVESRPAFVLGDFNPPLPASSMKRRIDQTQAGWSAVFDAGDFEGAYYFSYFWQLLEWPGGGQMFEWAKGDLDGNGSMSDKQMLYSKNVGLFECLPVWGTGCEWPEIGLEETTGF